MARKRRSKTAKPTIPNVGLQKEYQRKLDTLINAMNKDISRAIEKMYGGKETEITEDASPSQQLTRLINRRMVKWRGVFDTESEEIARWMIKRADSVTKAQLGRSLAKASGMTVQFRTTEDVEEVLDDLVAWNVDLIKSIPVEYHGHVNEAVMESVRAGRDLGGLTKTLDQKYDITKRRAAMIARDQNNKATEAIGLKRNQSLGITEGDWMHRSGSKEPRGSHQAAHGKRFKLSEGLLIDGEMILPGELYNCNCTFRPVIPGL